MAANTKKDMYFASFGSVFVDDISVSISVYELSAFRCFSSVLFSGLCDV